MTPEYLSGTGVAKHIGLADTTVESYLRKGLLPEPDIWYIMRNGRRPAWAIDTIEDWMNNRPGRGNRSPRNKRTTSAS